VQDSSESVEGDLFETYENCTESYSDDTGCLRIKVKTNSTEFTIMRIAEL